MSAVVWSGAGRGIGWPARRAERSPRHGGALKRCSAETDARNELKEVAAVHAITNNVGCVTGAPRREAPIPG
jgi:hypothetical protein